MSAVRPRGIAYQCPGTWYFPGMYQYPPLQTQYLVPGTRVPNKGNVATVGTNLLYPQDNRIKAPPTSVTSLY